MPKPSIITRVANAWGRLTQRIAPPARFRRSFSGAAVDRLTASWMATEASINQELRSDLNRLRSRGRDLIKNNDYARKFRGMCEDNIVGPNGIRFQSRVLEKPGVPDRAANTAIETAWEDWGTVCDITGHQNLRDICATLVGGLPSDGEFLVRMITGAGAGNKYGFALQLIDVDRIDTTYNQAATAQTNAIIMGVEVNAYRRPVAMHLFAAHPAEGLGHSRQRERVPMDQLIHGYVMDRPEQLRGVPWMATGMLSLHHLGNFMQSALLAAEHGANHYGFFSKTDDGGPPVIGTEEAGQAITTTQPGTYDVLPDNTTFIPHESKYPNEVFGPFVKSMLQRVASGWRVAYHSLANDLEGVSFSSIRSGTLEERDRWSVDQQWFIATFMERVYQNWLRMALLMGAITMPSGTPLPAAKIDKFARHEWQPRRWEWVDPQSDMQAKVMAVTAGLMPPQALASAMGYDFEDTITAIAEAQKLAAKLGVKLPAYDPKPGAQQTAPVAA